MSVANLSDLCMHLDSASFDRKFDEEYSFLRNQEATPQEHADEHIDLMVDEAPKET